MLALRNVLESVYSYFSYDINTYISSQLETTKPDLHEEAVIRSSTDSLSKLREHPQAQMSRDSDSDKDAPIASTYEDNSSLVSSSNNIPKRPPNKLVSNFTVENILMGPQHNSSSSSKSPSSAGSSLASPTTSLDYTSVMGGNWVSHPPVKYTKFTMLSPISMGEETQKKKKVRTEPSSSPMPEASPPRRHSSSNDLSLSSSPATERHRIGMRRVPSNPTVTEKHNHGIKRVASNSAVTPTLSQMHSFYSSSAASHSASFPTMSSRATVSKSISTEVGGITQSKSHQFPVQPVRTKSVSTLPVIQAVPFPSTGVKANLQQTFPPSQQFVLLVPSTSTRVSEGLQAVVYSNPTQVVPLNSSSNQSAQTVRAPSSAKRNHTGGHVSDSHTATESSIVSPENTTNDLEKLPVEVNYRPIAPKIKSVFSRESLSTTPINKHCEKRNKRSLPKPQKLRFHMTTVVKRPKRTVVTSSMTVESPSIINERTRTTSFVLHSQPSADILAEANIMKSKNNYSNVKQSEEQEERMDESEDSESTLNDSPRASVDSSETKEFHKSTPSHDRSIVRNDSGFHHQTLQNVDSSDNHMVDNFHDENYNSAGSSRDNGRTTRSYTRRKRELTFHRYEDPETAFKVKRASKE